MLPVKLKGSAKSIRSSTVTSFIRCEQSSWSTADMVFETKETVIFICGENKKGPRQTAGEAEQRRAISYNNIKTLEIVATPSIKHQHILLSAPIVLAHGVSDTNRR